VMVRIKNGEIIVGGREQTVLCTGYIAPFEQHLASYGYRPKAYHALGRLTATVSSHRHDDAYGSRDLTSREGTAGHRPGNVVPAPCSYSRHLLVQRQVA